MFPFARIWPCFRWIQRAFRALPFSSRALCGLAFTVSLVCLNAQTTAAESIGRRPYELDWANRQADDHPPLVDFENLDGWRVECKDAVARLDRTREQQLWDAHVGKLTYRSSGNAPEVRILPPAPMRITNAFDAVTLWIYGNNWGYAPDPKTPAVVVSALFADPKGNEFRVYLYQVDWTEWYLLHRRLAPEQIEQARNGATFQGLLISGGRNQDDRVLYFDNLAVFTEQFPPLTFEPRPQRGIPMFPGQSAGNNIGPGKLPFPTRPQTILPDNLTSNFTTTAREEGKSFIFTYQGADGRLVYRLTPESGTWSDLSAQWFDPPGPNQPSIGRGEFKPCLEGGLYLQTAPGPRLPEKAEALGTRLNGEAVESRWRISAGGVSAEATYTYRLWNKSLVVDIVAKGGQVAEARFGRAAGLANPRLVTNPFYPAEGGRPAVVVSGSPEAPLFLTGNADWYLSNGSILWAENTSATDRLVYNGGTRYLPKTDGHRNDCYERFFITVSPRYEETLPTIANPASPWKHVTGTRVWRAHGASDRERDARFWTECHRWGMTQVVVTDHETGWRDGGESFTFRTRPAPGKGGDRGQYDYARLMQDQLGFVYGPYNNFTDFAPVNEYWSTDLISRSPDNQLQHAWMRCYAPKPARAVEYCARLAPQIEKKFQFSTAYCDVHTAVAPWHRVDYDPRVPGAGTFAAVFYAYGEIMLLQKQAWDGPVYSEGNFHSFYTGLTDGNYGQDQSYRPAKNPWLVDFDLRKMHDLGCNFGMGNPDMFYASQQPMPGAREARDAWVDRFLAATVAFGHPGFLTYEGGLPYALRSYYLLQQLHSRYCLASASEIRYAEAQGRLLDTSAAVASGAYQRSQVLTRYSDGTITAANGHPSERMVVQAYGRQVNLPPNGYGGWTEDGAIEVWSDDARGHRADYAVTPAYLYVDGRGRFTRFAKASGNGIGICRWLPNQTCEVLTHGGAECGFEIDAKSAVAVDQAGKDLGLAQLRQARGLTYVLPVQGAFSYRLRGATSQESKTITASQLRCERDEVFAGERVIVRGRAEHVVQIPTDAKAGQRIWIEREGAWIDFTVAPLAVTTVALEGNAALVKVSSNLPRREQLIVRLGNREQPLTVEPGRPAAVTFDLGVPTEEDATVLPVEVRAGNLSQKQEQGLRTVRSLAPLLPLPEKWTRGMRLRGHPEQSDFGQTGTVAEPRRVFSGGVEKDGFFMHPPWMGGSTGYAFIRYEPLLLPADAPAAFRAVVGKGDGSDLGDGIWYQVVVEDESGRETVAGKQTVKQHGWIPLEADLSAWAGKRIVLKLIADPGPSSNSSGDWGCWADLRIETLRPVLHRHLESNLDICRHEPGPHANTNVTLEQCRAAKSGKLYYDGKGLSGTGQYGTLGVLNGIVLGNLAPASGDETRGVFHGPVSIPLTPEAIRSLGRHNRFAIRNPHGDCFSVRRFWLELELADGTKCASDISTATFTQPTGWLYAEGIQVSSDEEITVDIWFKSERRAQAAKPLIGVYYFPGWYRPGGATAKPPYDRASDWSEWRGAIMKAAKPRPLAGFYNDASPALWDYYVDWMSSHGIDFLAFDWYYNAGQEYLAASLDEGYLGSANSNRTRFCLHWCNHGGSWWSNRLDQSPTALADMIDRVGPRYFSRANYLRLDGRPVFMIYDTEELLRFGGEMAVSAGLRTMREHARPWGGLYLVAVYSHTGSALVEKLRTLGYDAFCAYTYVGQRGPNVCWDAKAYPYREVADNVAQNIFPFLARTGREKGIPYWPTTFSGWDDRPRAGLERATVLTDNTPAEFGRLFRSALRQVNPASPVVMVEAWNEWGEGANIEPSREYGFGYLEQIRSALREAMPDGGTLPVSKPRIPSAEEMRSWSILNDQELAVAHQNEQKPWPVQPTFWNRKGRNTEVPAVPLPYVFDFAKIPPTQLECNQVKILGQDAEGLLIKTTGTDPSINLPLVRLPTQTIRRLTLEAEASDAPGDFSFEVFWSTGPLPDFTAFASFVLPLSSRMSISTEDIMTWTAAGTPLERLRLDPGMRTGVTLKLKKLVLGNE